MGFGSLPRGLPGGDLDSRIGVGAGRSPDFLGGNSNARRPISPGSDSNMPSAVQAPFIRSGRDPIPGFNPPAGGGGQPYNPFKPNGQPKIPWSGPFVSPPQKQGIPTDGNYSAQNGLLNTTGKDPRVEQVQKDMAQRFKTLSSQEGKMDPFLQESINNLRNRQSSSNATRAGEMANASARDMAAGIESRMASQGARTGHGAGFGNAAAESQAQRLGARQNAQIQMNELGRQDNLALGGAGILQSPSNLGLANRGQTNNFLLGSAGYANQGANLGLAQQGLGLQQWQAGNDASYKQALLNQQNQQGMFDNYLRMFAATGY